jgi:ribosomal protein L7/L12
MEIVIGNLIGFTLGTIMALIYFKCTAMASRMERKLDLLLKHAGVDVEKAALEEAAVLCRAGKKIEALQLYRDHTGCSLAEAKARVEGIAG